MEQIKIVFFDVDGVTFDVYQIMASGRVPERPNMIKNTENVKIAAWWDRAFDIVPADFTISARKIS